MLCTTFLRSWSKWNGQNLNMTHDLLSPELFDFILHFFFKKENKSQYWASHNESESVSVSLRFCHTADPAVLQWLTDESINRENDQQINQWYRKTVGCRSIVPDSDECVVGCRPLLHCMTDGCLLTDAPAQDRRPPETSQPTRSWQAAQCIKPICCLGNCFFSPTL